MNACVYVLKCRLGYVLYECMLYMYVLYVRVFGMYVCLYVVYVALRNTCVYYMCVCLICYLCIMSVPMHARCYVA